MRFNNVFTKKKLLTNIYWKTIDDSKLDTLGHYAVSEQKELDCIVN